MANEKKKFIDNLYKRECRGEEASPPTMAFKSMVLLLLKEKPFNLTYYL